MNLAAWISIEVLFRSSDLPWWRSGRCLSRTRRVYLRFWGKSSWGTFVFPQRIFLRCFPESNHAYWGSLWWNRRYVHANESLDQLVSQQQKLSEPPSDEKLAVRILARDEVCHKGRDLFVVWSFLQDGFCDWDESIRLVMLWLWFWHDMFIPLPSDSNNQKKVIREAGLNMFIRSAYQG